MLCHPHEKCLYTFVFNKPDGKIDYNFSYGRDGTRSRMFPKNIPIDCLESFLDIYKDCYHLYLKRWNNGYSSAHYARKKNIPPVIKTFSYRTRTPMCIDFTCLEEQIPRDDIVHYCAPNTTESAAFTVHHRS